MPHCDKELYARTFPVITERRSDAVIIGNSLKNYVDKHDALSKKAHETVEQLRVKNHIACDQ